MSACYTYRRDFEREQTCLFGRLLEAGLRTFLVILSPCDGESLLREDALTRFYFVSYAAQDRSNALLHSCAEYPFRSGTHRNPKRKRGQRQCGQSLAYASGYDKTRLAVLKVDPKAQTESSFDVPIGIRRRIEVQLDVRRELDVLGQLQPPEHFHAVVVGACAVGRVLPHEANPSQSLL